MDREKDVFEKREIGTLIGLGYVKNNDGDETVLESIYVQKESDNSIIRLYPTTVKDSVLKRDVPAFPVCPYMAQTVFQIQGVTLGQDVIGRPVFSRKKEQEENAEEDNGFREKYVVFSRFKNCKNLKSVTYVD